ncbi:hypothetical protein D3C80_1632240 [compost metagenome]
MTCEVERPKDRVQRLLAAVEVVLERNVLLREQAPHVVRAIQQAAAPFALTFG